MTKTPQAKGDNPDLFDPAQAAAYLRIKPQTLATWRSSGRHSVPYVKVGRMVRYRRCDLDAWLESRLVSGGE